MIRVSTFLLVFATLFSACHRPHGKSKKALDEAKDTTAAIIKKDSVALAVVQKKDTTKVIEESKFEVQSTDFKYLTAKSKISFKSSTQSLDNATLNLRIKKDSIIWMSVYYGGVMEIARGIITKDSIIFLNQVQQEYYKYDFEGLSKAFNFKLSYDLLQSILVGNMPIPKKSSERFKKENDYFLLKQDEGKVQIDNYIGEQNKRLKKLLVTEQPTKNSLTLDYDDFTTLNNYLFPFTSLIQLDYQSKVDKQQYQTVFKIKHQKIEISDKPITFPFTVSAKYKRK